MGRSFGRHGIRLGRVVAVAALVLGSGSVVALVTATSAAAATTLKVATTGSDTGNCQASNCLTLGYALSQAAAGDTILLEPGTYASSHNPSGTSDTVGASLTGLTPISHENA